MMGHAYYANYLLWFEQARGAWCRDRGFTYRGLEESGYKLPVVEAHLRYRGEVLYDDLITVRCQLVEVRRAAMKFEYVVANEHGQRVTEGYTWHVLVGEERKAVSAPTEVRQMLERDPDQYPTVA